MTGGGRRARGAEEPPRQGRAFVRIDVAENGDHHAFGDKVTGVMLR